MARTMAEASERIFQLTGLRAGPARCGSSSRTWGLSSPGPPVVRQKRPRHARDQTDFLEGELKPRLEAAIAGGGHVFFVDAAHFVFGPFLCLWSFARIFVRAASGRRHFSDAEAWDAVARRLIAVTSTTVVNTETMCQLLREIAAAA